MAHERLDIPIKETNDFDDEYDNDGLDDYSDDYDDDRYAYADSTQQDRRREHSFSYSGSGHSNEINEDNRKDHHNQLERKRRASIKSSYTELREAIPSLRDNKASRSVILQKAVDYLEELNKRNVDHVACVDHFSSENTVLEAQCREMESQVQMILSQQRQNGHSNPGPHHSAVTMHARSSLRVRDEEDSNDLSGSTNSTPTASTSRSATSSMSAGVPAVASDPRLAGQDPECSIARDSLVDQPVESGSNSSSAEYYDDIEDVVVSKRSRTE